MARPPRSNAKRRIHVPLRVKMGWDGVYSCRDKWEYGFHRRGIFVIEKVALFTACEWRALSFRELSQTTIFNAWRKADIIPDRRSSLAFCLDYSFLPYFNISCFYTHFRETDVLVSSISQQRA
jgi:hypothetical protein